MAAGGDTFINDMMNHCGFKNIFENRLRYPEITIEEIKAYECKVLLLSSEPFPFKQKHINELQSLLPDTKILLADGEVFSWYGAACICARLFYRIKKRFRELNLTCTFFFQVSSNCTASFKSFIIAARQSLLPI
jgi:hypothetical protein